MASSSGLAAAAAFLVGMIAGCALVDRRASPTVDRPEGGHVESSEP